MEKFLIPPLLIVYSILSMTALYLFVPQFNLIYFPFNLAGLLVALSGLMLMGKAKNLFKKYSTTLRIEKSSYFIKEGVFLKSRNPMYVGMSVLILGFSVLSTNIIALLLPFIFSLVVRAIFIKKEEQLMYDVFGESYLEYKKTVKRWF